MKLSELVREQVLAGGPQHEHANFAEAYVDDRLNEMSHVAFLELISDKLDKLLEDYVPR